MSQDLAAQKRQDLTIFRFDDFDHEMLKPAKFKVRGLFCAVSRSCIGSIRIEILNRPKA
jgi:hypothetical protein